MAYIFLNPHANHRKKKRSRVELQNATSTSFEAIYQLMDEEEKPKRQVDFTTEADKRSTAHIV